jgi:hypothetical protein
MASHVRFIGNGQKYLFSSGTNLFNHSSWAGLLLLICFSAKGDSKLMRNFD